VYFVQIVYDCFPLRDKKLSVSFVRFRALHCWLSCSEYLRRTFRHRWRPLKGIRKLDREEQKDDSASTRRQCRSDGWRTVPWPDGRADQPTTWPTVWKPTSGRSVFIYKCSRSLKRRWTHLRRRYRERRGRRHRKSKLTDFFRTRTVRNAEPSICWNNWNWENGVWGCRAGS
jgi:hypothetical protein